MALLPGVSADRFESCLERVGFGPTRVAGPGAGPVPPGENLCVFSILKNNALAVLFGYQPDDSFAVAFLLTRIKHPASLRDINAYNESRRFLRFVLEDDGLVHVRMELLLLDLPDQVVDQNLVFWYSAVADFLKSLSPPDRLPSGRMSPFVSKL